MESETPKCMITAQGNTETPILYDASSIDTLDWPDTPAGQYAKFFLTPLVKEGLKSYVSNIDAEYMALKIDNMVLPVLIPHSNTRNSYVCSPYQHYITFGKEHIDLLNNAFLIRTVLSVFPLIEKMALYGRLNSVVYVNHWLYSTDLYPKELKRKHLDKTIAFLAERFPERAIIMRSLNAITSPSLLHDLEEMKCQMIPSRQVYVSDCKDESIFQTRIVKSDLRLWYKKIYQVIDGSQIESQDCAQLLNLERLLYIIQHSDLHPQYTLNFIKLMKEHRLLQFKALRHEGEYIGVAGYYECDGTMFCPFFGFDKVHPDHNVIFRLLNTALLLEAKQHGWLFHQSAGASFYKSVRHAKGTLEFMAVSARHLPKKQQLTWLFLKQFMNTFALKAMRNY